MCLIYIKHLRIRKSYVYGQIKGQEWRKYHGVGTDPKYNQQTQKANRTIVETETKINAPNTYMTTHFLGHFNKSGGVQLVF
jgi:hypothetical protein